MLDISPESEEALEIFPAGEIAPVSCNETKFTLSSSIVFELIFVYSCKWPSSVDPAGADSRFSLYSSIIG